MPSWTYPSTFQSGYFYVIQPIPDYPYHLKVGIAQDVERRLKEYKTLCPQARVLNTWHCFNIAEEEKHAIDLLIRKRFKRLGPEVFFCPHPEKLISTLETHFAENSYQPRTRKIHLTIAEVAERSGKEYAHIYHLIQLGTLPSIRRSRSSPHLISAKVVAAWLAQQTEQ